MGIVFTEGAKRRITTEEAKNYKTKYSWVITEAYTYEDNEKDQYIEVPVGFLTDGSTMSPDVGMSWIFHDYLYSTHKFSNGNPCRRVEADRVMISVLKNTKYNHKVLSLYSSLYAGAVSMISYYNPPYAFSDAWTSSGERGPEFLKIYDSENDDSVDSD